MKAGVLIECIAGPMTGQLMERMPSRSTCLMYGLLSEKGIADIDPLLFIGRGQKIEGWILGDWIAQQGVGIISVIGKANSLVQDGTLASNIQKKFSLQDFQESIAEYYKNMSGGKFLLCPNMTEPTEESAQFSIKEL